MFKMSDQGPEPLVLFLSLLLYLGFELSFCSMDFPADITLRKTRMKFELTFKVVLLFSYQGFAFVRKLLYFITSTLFVKNFFSNIFQLLFESFFSRFNFIRLGISFFKSCNFYIYIAHLLFCSRSFFSFFPKEFFHFSFKLMCSHVRRMLSYHRVASSSRVFFIFLK